MTWSWDIVETAPAAPTYYVGRLLSPGKVEYFAWSNHQDALARMLQRECDRRGATKLAPVVAWDEERKEWVVRYVVGTCTFQRIGPNGESEWL